MSCKCKKFAPIEYDQDICPMAQCTRHDQRFVLEVPPRFPCRPASVSVRCSAPRPAPPSSGICCRLGTMASKSNESAAEVMRDVRGRRWRADDARRVLAAWRSSGLSAAEFGRRHEFDEQRLGWWRKRLASSPKPKRKRKRKVTRARLVPAKLVVAKPLASPGGAPRPPISGVVVHVPGGVVVEADSATVSPAWVAALLRELTRS